MKNLIFGLFVLATFTASAGEKVGKLEIGDKAVLTDVKMKSVSGTELSINDVAGKNGTLVIFSCNTCPFVMRWEGRYPGLKEFAEENGVGMIVLNSNYSNRDGVDSYTAMVEHAKEKGYNFPYVVDQDSRIANAFGGQTTPHAFLFNNKMELVYKGVIDDNAADPSAVKKAYLKDALESLGSGDKIAVAQTPPQGCSIKRKLD
ncbi:MAG: redoxin family protein [Prolixibacteraceae bacterium]|nr:redoxin family protein [Prolixibacteraceae bacterium]MBN2774953.1 redoxin family protein [Prolixibacteraceae bacterium]